jgi:hypothetical protein
VPARYHATCDDYLFVIGVRGTICMGEADPFEVSPGRLVFFKKGTVHALTVIEEPFVFLSVDMPRRDPKDIPFVNPANSRRTRLSTRGNSTKPAPRWRASDIERLEKRWGLQRAVARPGLAKSTASAPGFVDVCRC